MRAHHHSRFGVVRVSERSTVSGPPRGRAPAPSQLLDVWWGAAVCVARRGAVPGNLVRILRWERRDGTSTRDRGGASAPQGARVPTPRRLRRRLRHKFFPAVAKSDARRRADRAGPARCARSVLFQVHSEEGRGFRPQARRHEHGRPAAVTLRSHEFSRRGPRFAGASGPRRAPLARDGVAAA